MPCALLSSSACTSEGDQLVFSASGTVRMSISPAIGLGLLPQALHQFAQQYPQVAVECRDGLYPGIAPLLRDGTLDVALTPVHRIHLEPDLIAEPLYESQVVIVAQRGHPLSRARRLVELAECEWVLSSPSSGPGAVIEEAFAQAGLPRPRIRMLCESFLALPAVIAASTTLRASSGLQLSPPVPSATILTFPASRALSSAPERPSSAAEPIWPRMSITL